MIENAKGKGNFIPEVSMDETDAAQSPVELLIILAAIADEGIPVQTIAPKFSGRFNKGVDYIGDVDQFGREFALDLAAIAYAFRQYSLPKSSPIGAKSPAASPALPNVSACAGSVSIRPRMRAPCIGGSATRPLHRARGTARKLSLDRTAYRGWQETGAECVHPGYGFLSESAEFAEACEQAGLVFVGPPAAAIRAMGLKDRAKALMEKARVPIVPGYHGERQDTEFLEEKADAIGYPVLIKPAAGGLFFCARKIIWHSALVEMPPSEPKVGSGRSNYFRTTLPQRTQ